MSTSPEYKTLISLTGELRCAFQSNLVPLSDSLKAEYLILPENASQLRNPMHSEVDRAAYLVDIIQNKVQQNAQHYHTFVRVLESQGREYYHDILSKLDVAFQQRSDTSQRPVPPLKHQVLLGENIPTLNKDIFTEQNLTIAVVELRSTLDPDCLAKILNQTPPYIPANFGVTFYAVFYHCYQFLVFNTVPCGSFVLLVGVVLAFYYGPWQSGSHQQDCTKIESPRVLFQELKEIGPWEHLCHNLGVSTATMESLKHDSAQNTEKKRQCLKAFYDEDTERGVKVCWETVLKAVSSFPISNQKLAKKIANKYNINTEIIDP